MNDSEPYQRARSAALVFLSHRSRSEAEVRTRLRRRFSSTVVDAVAAALKEEGLLDDTRFARLWSESRDSHRPRSAIAISRELVSKGVDKEVAKAAVQDLDDGDSAHRAGEKFARRLRQVDYPTFRRRLWGHLQRLGYTPSVARGTVDRLWSDHRDEGVQAQPPELDQDS